MPITPTIPIPGIVIDKLTYPVKKLLGFTAKNSMQAQGKSEKEIIQDLIKRDDPSFYSWQTRDGGNEIDTYLYGIPYNTENTSNVGPSYENYLSKNFPLRKHAVKTYDTHFGDTLYIDQKYKDQVLDELEQGKTVGASMGRYAHAPSYIINTKDDERRPYDAGGHLMQFQYDKDGNVIANMSDIYDFLPKDFEEKYGAVKEYGPLKTAGMYAMHYAGTPFIVRQNGIPVRFKEIVPEYKTELQSQLGNFLSNWGNIYDLTIPHRLTDEQIEEIFDGKQSGDEILDFMDQKGYLAPVFKKGGSIHIKKKNRGKFTDYCGGKVTEECIAKGKKSKDPKIRKRATFAANARKWKHANGGPLGKPNFKESKDAYYDPETDTVFAPDSSGEFYHHEMFHARPNLQLLESLKPYYHNLNDDVLKQMGADLSFVKRFNNDPGHFYSPEELGARVTSAAEMLKQAGVQNIDESFLKEARLNENKYGDNFRDLLYMYNDENLIKIFNTFKYQQGGIIRYQDPPGELPALVQRVNKSKANFVQRLLDPNRKHIQNWVNPLSISTHKLGWATEDTKQGAFVYPEVQEIDGELVDFTHPSHLRSEGINSAIERRDTVRMTPEQAKWFTENYKQYYPGFQNGGNLYSPHPLSPVGIALNQAKASAKNREGQQKLPSGLKELIGPDGKKVIIRTEQPLIPLEQSIAEWLPGTGDVAEIGYIANDVKNGNLKSAVLTAGLMAIPGNISKARRSLPELSFHKTPTYGQIEVRDLVDFANSSGLDKLSDETFESLSQLVQNAQKGIVHGSTNVKVAKMIRDDLKRFETPKGKPLDRWQQPFDEMIPMENFGHRRKTTEQFRLSDHKNGGILKAQEGTGNLHSPHPLSPLGIAMNNTRIQTNLKYKDIPEDKLPQLLAQVESGVMKEVIDQDGKAHFIKTEQPLQPLEQNTAEWLPGTGDVVEVGYIADDVKNGNYGSAALAAGLTFIPGNWRKVLDTLMPSKKDKFLDFFSKEIGKTVKRVPVTKNDFQGVYSEGFRYLDESGKEIAHIAGSRHGDRVFVESSFMDPEFRSKGIGKQMYFDFNDQMFNKYGKTIGSDSGQHMMTLETSPGIFISPSGRMWRGLRNKGLATTENPPIVNYIMAEPKVIKSYKKYSKGDKL